MFSKVSSLFRSLFQARQRDTHMPPSRWEWLTIEIAASLTRMVPSDPGIIWVSICLGDVLMHPALNRFLQPQRHFAMVFSLFSSFFRHGSRGCSPCRPACRRSDSHLMFLRAEDRFLHSREPRGASRVGWCLWPFCTGTR
jgi:hypothetical protein